MQPLMSASWKLTLPCTRQEAEAISDRDDLNTLFDPVPPIVTQETEAFNDLKWELLAYFPTVPSSDVIELICTLIPSAISATPQIEQLPETDWLLESQQGIKPVIAGRFYVHTGSNRGDCPPDAIPFQIEASQAFGTGGHETTSGCLTMLDWLKRAGSNFHHVADIGTGTGLLAFAAQHLWSKAYFTASDIDPISIDVSFDNALINNVAIGQRQGNIALCVACGTDHEMIQRRAPYDLVIANILAGPLIELAASFENIMGDGSKLILAGLLNTQVDAVRRAYRAKGFMLVKRVDNGDWPCILLQKRKKYAWLRPVRAGKGTSQPPGDFGTW
jgi:ribosomal protein L11 methyltransferase